MLHHRVQCKPSRWIVPLLDPVVDGTHWTLDGWVHSKVVGEFRPDRLKAAEYRHCCPREARQAVFAPGDGCLAGQVTPLADQLRMLQQHLHAPPIRDQPDAPLVVPSYCRDGGGTASEFGTSSLQKSKADDIGA